MCKPGLFGVMVATRLVSDSKIVPEYLPVKPWVFMKYRWIFEEFFWYFSIIQKNVPKKL